MRGLFTNVYRGLKETYLMDGKRNLPNSHTASRIQIYRMSGQCSLSKALVATLVASITKLGFGSPVDCQSLVDQSDTLVGGFDRSFQKTYGILKRQLSCWV